MFGLSGFRRTEQNQKKLYQIDYYGQLSKDALLQKIQQLVPEWKVFLSGKYYILQSLTFATDHSSWRMIRLQSPMTPYI